MSGDDVGPDWKVEWATRTLDDSGYSENLVLTREEALEYGDELVMTLRVDGNILQQRGIDPEEPFAWKIENGELLTKQISRRSFERVAEDDRSDSDYARHVLKHRAKRRLQNFG
jgi:hypothetical protein